MNLKSFLIAASLSSGTFSVFAENTLQQSLNVEFNAVCADNKQGIVLTYRNLDNERVYCKTAQSLLQTDGSTEYLGYVSYFLTSAGQLVIAADAPYYHMTTLILDTVCTADSGAQKEFSTIKLACQ